MPKTLLDYYIENSDKRFDALESKVDQLLSLKWKLIGAGMAVSGIISILIEVAKAMAQGK